MVKVNLGTKDSSEKIKIYSSFIVEPSSLKKKNHDFLTELNQEVVKCPSKAKKLKKTILATQAVCLSLLALAQPTSAMGINPSIEVPSEAAQIMVEIMVIVAILGVGATIIGLMLAGLWKAFFGGNQADVWTTNILKGFGQIVVAPAVVSLIVLAANLLFGGLPIFQPIGDAISAFLKR